ncbi:STY4526/YPO1902 family pathogenicity island replication protein [Salinisphaera hydrothermalis]|uniref:STY4526/YPO1902 family pathogenicity island replication protein n=1 Tax=Salinisphaera TaxID=180541 RepID=UPI00068F62F9|nr:STY4526/YPO1902 family pathogenicity island replication protein [Salinisphaera hydrothermalis]
MPTKEYELTLATLIYAAACLEDGDWAVLRDLNFGEQEISALQGLAFPDFLSLARRMNGHVLNIRLDRERFWLILSEMKQERAIAQLKTEMVRRDAPVDMMRQLFGMTESQYTTMRRRWRRRRGAGRPPEPDTETMDIMWQAWQRQGEGRTALSAGEWLALSKDTDVDLRTLWRFIRGTNEIERTL